MKKIKVCHITKAHNRYDGRILSKECISLANAGYDVTFLVCDDFKNEVINKVKIISAKIKFNNRYARFLYSNKKLMKKIKEINADIYHLHDPDLLLIAKRIKKNHKKVIFDSHEDYPAIILERKWIPAIIRKFASIIYKQYERKIFKKIDGVVTVTPHIEERIKKININTVTVTNYPILNEKIIKKDFLREVCFAGSIEDFYNHDKIILAISEINNVTYKLAGNMTLDYFNILKKLNGFDKVELLGFLNKEKIYRLYSRASIGMCICSYRANVGYKRGSLGITKFFEYMAHGLPIICTDFDIFKQIIDKYKCGFYVNPYDIDDIKEKIERIINNKSLMREMSLNSFKAAKKEFNWSIEENKLLNFYKTIINK